MAPPWAEGVEKAKKMLIFDERSQDVFENKGPGF
jgi:hypothetical protein